MFNFSKSNGSRTRWLSWMSWRSVPGIKKINILINPWFSEDPLWSKKTSGMIKEYELSIWKAVRTSKQLQIIWAVAFSDLSEVINNMTTYVYLNTTADWKVDTQTDRSSCVIDRDVEDCGRCTRRRTSSSLAWLHPPPTHLKVYSNRGFEGPRMDAKILKQRQAI